MPEGIGTLSVRTELRPVAKSEYDSILGTEQPEAGKYVVLEVKDDGVGMDAATQKRIFEPFFSTKAEGRGLGLSGCLGIVQAHKGMLMLDSAPQKGTCFRVFFPPDAAASASQPETTAVSAKKLDLQVLVVDDESAVRTFVSNALSRWGASSQTAEDGAKGVALFEAAPDRYNLVIMDLAMPELNGEEAFLRLRQIRKDIPVLFISGYGAQEMLHRVSSAPGVSFLAKPFTLQRLRESLEALMGIEH